MRLLLLIIFSLFFQVSFSQVLNWELTIGPEPGSQNFTKVRNVNDSVFQALGRSNNDFVLVRFDKHGNNFGFLNLDTLASTIGPQDHLATSSNGFLLVGGNSSGRTWIGSFDSLGNPKWEHILNLTGGNSDFHKVRELNDGGYLAIGDRLTDTNQYFQDVYAGRFDSLGNILWEKYFPILFNQSAHDFVEMPDGSFFISGYSETVALGATPYIMQIDIKGNLIAEHYPQINGFSNMDINYSRIDLMKNGSAVMIGHSSDPINSKRAFIISFDTMSTVIWDTIFFKGSTSVIKPLETGGAFYQGYTLDSGIFLLELDGNGNGVKYFNQANGLQKTMFDIELSSEGFMIGVGKDGTPGQSLTNELYAARYDSVGEAFVPDYCTWNLPEAAFYYDYQAPILTLYDSSFSGLQYHDSIYQYQWYTSQGDTSFSDSLLTLFDTSGNNTLDVTLIVSNWHGCMDTITRNLDFQVSGAEHMLNENAIRMYPNPAESVLSFELKDRRYEDFDIRILDLHGKVVHSTKTLSSATILDISFLSSGMYILEVQSQKDIFRKKWVKQ